MSLPGGGRRWFVIVNPVAGGGRGLDHFPLISKLLRDAGIQTEPVFTEHKFHATELTVSAVKQGFRRIIAVGGDGTLHEVVNGLFIQQTVDPREVLLAVVAVGAGNDWIRTFGVPNRYQDAIRAIKEGHSFLQDVGVVSYEEAHYRQHRYMANVAGMGFDAMVVKKYAHLKKKGHRNKWLYTWCMIRSFFSYKSTGVKVWIDDRLVYNNLLMSIAIGVCKYNGGGMQQLPEAVADDGLLDVSLIRPVHFWHILFRFRYLFNGGIYRIRHILQERGSRIRIESSPEISVRSMANCWGSLRWSFPYCTELFGSWFRRSSSSGRAIRCVRAISSDLIVLCDEGRNPSDSGLRRSCRFHRRCAVCFWRAVVAPAVGAAAHSC